MNDFDVTDVGYVASLKARIHELEQDVAALSASDESWERFCRTKDAEIKALREGACRFNCRKKRDMFIDGFRYGMTKVVKDMLGPDHPGIKWSDAEQECAELAYKEHLDEQERNVQEH